VIGLDTNVLVRYLAQDDAAQARVATTLIEKELTSEAPGFISLIVLVETLWVLEDCYDCSKERSIEILQRILRVKQLVIEEAQVVSRAAQVFSTSSADFADCLIERIGHARGCDHTVTFDRGAAKIPGMKLLAKA
jgi:predicted nucleic-acid-binding protein